MSLIFSEGGVGGVTEEELQAAVDELQGQIDTISAASDCADIVGTYTDLQNYDTSTLSDNAIIKVLNDSTHNGQPSYYRWSTSTEQFTYIGSEERVNDGTLTIKYGAETVGTFSANQSTNATVNLPSTDLSNYYNKTQTDALLETKIPTDSVTVPLGYSIISHAQTSVENNSTNFWAKYGVSDFGYSNPSSSAWRGYNYSQIITTASGNGIINPDYSILYAGSVSDCEFRWTADNSNTSGYYPLSEGNIVIGNLDNDGKFTPYYYVGFTGGYSGDGEDFFAINPSTVTLQSQDFDSSHVATRFNYADITSLFSIFPYHNQNIWAGRLQIIDNNGSPTFAFYGYDTSGNQVYTANSSSNPYNVNIEDINCIVAGIRHYQASSTDYNYDLDKWGVYDLQGNKLWSVADTTYTKYLQLNIGAGLAVQDGNLVNTNPTAPTVMTGATSSTAGTAGLVPAPAAGDDTKFLSGDGTYKTVTTDLSNYIQKTDVAYPTIYGRKTPVTVNSNTGVIRINPVGNLSTPTYFPDIDIQNGTIVIPTTARGNLKLDTNQVLGYYGDIVDTNITFPSQFVHNQGALTYVIIGNLNESIGVFDPGLVCTDSGFYSFEAIQASNIVSNGVTCTIWQGVFSPFTSTTSSSSQVYNTMEIREGSNNTISIATVLKQASGSPSEELVYSVTTSNVSYNCVIFGLSTLNNRYYYNDFTITDTNNTEIWKPTPTTVQSYLNISIGSGLTVTSSGQLAVSPDRVIGTGITNITKLTQAEYDALATKDANTFYAIVPASNS